MAKPTENVYRPCPCGSGEKYKFCCLQRDRERRRELLRQTPQVAGSDGEPVLVFDLEEGKRAHERGLDLVQHGKGLEAIPILERAIKLAPLVPQPYNNLSMAHFLAGDPEKALEICEKVDRVVDPGNVFALGNRVHFLLILGRRKEAEETGRRILSLQGRDENAVYKKCEALARLGWHEEVYSTAVRNLPRSKECESSLRFYAGTAAANLARYEEADRYLRDAADDRVHGPVALRHLECLRRRRGPGTLNDDWPYLEWGHWVPSGLLERIKKDEDARRFPGMVEVLVCLLNERPEDDAPLRMLGAIGTSDALNILRRISFGTFGSDALRMKAIRELQDRNAVGDDEPLDVWLQGHWQQIRSRRIEVTPEIASSVPEEVLDLMGHLLEALRAEDWSRAEALGRDVVEKAPENPQALYNFAMALLRQGRETEGEELLRRAIGLDPSYLFAPATLARLLLKRDMTTEARALLRNVRLPERVHPDGYALFLLAEAEVSLFEGNLEQAARAWEGAEKLGPDLAGVQAARRGWVRRLAEYVAGSKVRRRVALARQRTRLLSRDAGLSECLADYTLDQLRSTAQGVGLGGVSGLRKDVLRDRLVIVLAEPGVVRGLVRSLPERAREALRHVWAAGCSCAHDQFTRAYGADELEDGTPAPLSLLRDSGLVAEGTVGGRPSMLIPRELRSPVDQEFSTSQSRLVTGGP